VNDYCTGFSTGSLSVEVTGRYADRNKQISKVSINEVVTVADARLD